jgi:prepilin-type N-terminal cleavage/methylation domain-containing protein
MLPARGGRGFTLIEIMVVVAIIALLAGIAIPLLLRVRLNANEGAIKAELRTFSSACEGYRAKQNPPTYPADVDALASGTNAYLDPSWLLVDQPRHGYTISYAVGEGRYSLLATPAVAHRTGVNTFCVDQSGVIVGSVNGESAPTADAAGCEGGMAIGG